MEIKIIGFLLFIVTIVSCKNNSSLMKNTDKIQESSKKSDKYIVKSSGDYYRFHFKDDTIYTIEWGNKSFKNETKQTFEILGNGTLNLSKSGDAVIILEQSCGTSCSYCVVLPLKTGAKEKVFIQTISYDINKNLIVYIPEEETFIRIENYLTGEKLDILENNLCPAAFKGDCIDSVYFKGNNVIIKWQGSQWEDNKVDPQEKIIPITF